MRILRGIVHFDDIKRDRAIRRELAWLRSFRSDFPNVRRIRFSRELRDLLLFFRFGKSRVKWATLSLLLSLSEEIAAFALALIMRFGRSMIYSEKFELNRDIKDSAYRMIQVNAHTEYDRLLWFFWTQQPLRSYSRSWDRSRGLLFNYFFAFLAHDNLLGIANRTICESKSRSSEFSAICQSNLVEITKSFARLFSPTNMLRTRIIAFVTREPMLSGTLLRINVTKWFQLRAIIGSLIMARGARGR